MDWKFILSLAPDELNDEDKDELFNTVTWFDITSEELNVKKYSALFRISQEILKYKGEQVETLLHELDELAIKQGEEEAKKLESDTDARSSKSKKSSSLETENAEQKYTELRMKYKKQLKTNEKHLLEIEKLQKSIQNLNEEKKHLQSELQLARHDDSQSDISETVKEQHKELVDIINNKNRQISDLLRDIEEVERENFVLREKVTDLRDELSNATKELTILSENLKAAKIELNENIETLQRVNVENESLTNDIQDISEQKQHLQNQLEEFTEEVNLRIDSWKNLIDEKEKEIRRLKAALHAQSIKSSSSSPVSYNDDQSHISALSKVLNQREQQLLEVKTQLQIATKEMEESTVVIKKSKIDHENDGRYIEELKESVKRLEDQLKQSHLRGQELQDQLSFAEKDVQNKQKELNEIIAKLKKDGKPELAQHVGEMQELKAHNRVQEKQIMNLVKTTNKLQDSLDQYSRENEILRDKLGIPEDEVICTDAIALKHKIQKKDADKIKNRLRDMEEENLELKAKIHKLNKNISSLCNQIISMNAKPDVNYAHEGISFNKDEKALREQIKALSEENESLRKGLHEILNTLNSRKESSLREIKSETFEQLLRALDVKHISGWYHPAMRLQAELHNEQGINAELREQLRIVKAELTEYKGGSHVEDAPTPRSPHIIDGKESSSGALHMPKESETQITEEDENVEQGDKKSEANQVMHDSDDHLKTLVDKYKGELTLLQNKCKDFETQLKHLEKASEIAFAKLKVFEAKEDEDTITKKLTKEIENNINSNRKYLYLENVNTKLSDDILNLKAEIQIIKTDMSRKVTSLTIGNHQLRCQLKMSESNNESLISSDIYKEVQEKLDNITVKYRELLHNFKNITSDKQCEIDLLEKSKDLLIKEKQEFQIKVVDLLGRLHSFENINEAIDAKIEALSKKLAEVEVNEISERQRANHTNNLYELVREQLQKSEERFKEFEKYNKEILRKNLVLQENLKDIESKLSEYVDTNIYKEIQNERNSLLKENETLNEKVKNLEQSCFELENKVKTQGLWTSLQEQEMLSLKHQIVDLQAASDEKTVIAKISSDILHARTNESLWKDKFEVLNKEYDKCQQELEDSQCILGKTEGENAEKNAVLTRKIRLLQDLLTRRKFQYYGCIPLTSEEQYVQRLKEVFCMKHEAFKNMIELEDVKSSTLILKEQTETELNNAKCMQNLLSKDDKEMKKLIKWQQEKKIVLLNEVKCKRQLEFKEMQLKHALQRIQMQDSQLFKLEEELLQCHHNFEIASPLEMKDSSTEDSEDAKDEDSRSTVIQLRKSQEIQTTEITDINPNVTEDEMTRLKIEMLQANNEINTRDQQIQQLKGKITELEMNISLFRKQIGDKQSQITFYEKHILELQNRKEESSTNIDTIRQEEVSEETISLKSTIKCLQDSLSQKDQSLIKMQSLLKQDRDNHSMAAARMQEETRLLNKIINEEKRKTAELQRVHEESHPSKAAIEQYVHQVHALESHTAELHTKTTALESQLQASREEAVRWRSLANDRLKALDELRISLEQQHNSEIAFYKHDSEKWRQEVNALKEMFGKHKAEFVNVGSDVNKILKEKDDRINDLNIQLKQLKLEVKRQADKAEHGDVQKLSELELVKEQLLRENETLKKRFEQLMNRERSAREEIRELRGQLMRKPVSARSDKSDRSIKEQLQKKVNTLENEIDDLTVKLEHQMAINESHKLRIAADFDRWKKQKQWQQTVDKLKSKLKEKESETEKLQQTCSGYRILIERLEREKHNLENRIKNLKSSVEVNKCEEVENLKIENMRLQNEIENIKSKLEMQQHHSGSLGAAMLQEKLEGQERKIAILELSAKGTVEIRAELERLQTTISGLQKRNICLEAENLELKLDFEKSNSEIPYLKEQIHQLESYIETLKRDSSNEEGDNVREHGTPRSCESKQVSELERTVYILKRIVDKLQAENKRLVSGKRPFSDRPSSADRMKRDIHRLRDQYGESVRKIYELEKQLSSANGRLKIYENRIPTEDLSKEFIRMKEELEHKSQMLEKVKVLLQRAASKEKSLLSEITELREELSTKGP